MKNNILNQSDGILVSVIVPIFNVESYLERCVNSIQEQTYSNLEMLLIDDGSTDNSSTICERLCRNDKRIKVIHKTNGGLSSARNVGIDSAKGKFLSFVDADDYIADTFIEELLDLCVQYDAQMSQCGYFSVDDKSPAMSPVGHKTPKVYSPEVALKLCCEYRISERWINNVVTWNKLYDRDLFANIRFPEGKIHEDEFVTYKLKWLSNQIVVTDRCLYYYYRRRTGLSGTEFSLGRLDKLEAFKEKERFLHTHGFEKEYQETLLCRYRQSVDCYNKIREYFPDKHGILDQLIHDLSEMEKHISCFDSLKELDKIRLFYTRMNAQDKRNIAIQYGNLFPSNEIGISFLFPFDRVPHESKIVLYGAGKVGQDYFRQLSCIYWCEVVAWVDLAWKERQSVSPLVQSPARLMDTNFDYVVICNKSTVVSNDIKNNLIEWGVPDDKIILGNSNIPSIKGAEKNVAFFNDMKDLAGARKKVLLMNTPEHNNLGDHALAVSCNIFLQDLFPERAVVEITGLTWDTNKGQISRYINADDYIFIVGGGFMGSLWKNEDNRVKDIIAAFPNLYKILLPQSFYYENLSAIEEDVEFYQNLNRLMIIHREHFSKERFEKYISNSKEFLNCYPDMVFYLHPPIVSHKRSGGLLCLRKDKESALQLMQKDRIKSFFEQLGMSVQETDTVLNRNVSKQQRKVALENKIREFGDAEIVITDRLHGMIFAFITNTPCIAINNLTQKVEGVYSWVHESDIIHFLQAEDISVELIERIRNNKGIRENSKIVLDRLNQQFEKMKQAILYWIGI